MEDIAQWMASNRLKLNPAKTDFMWCATHRRRQHQLSKDHVTFAGSDIQPSSTVRDLGVILDSELSFGPHINQLVSRCFPAASPCELLLFPSQPVLLWLLLLLLYIANFGD